MQQQVRLSQSSTSIVLDRRSTPAGTPGCERTRSASSSSAYRSTSTAMKTNRTHLRNLPRFLCPKSRMRYHPVLAFRHLPRMRFRSRLIHSTDCRPSNRRHRPTHRHRYRHQSKNRYHLSSPCGGAAVHHRRVHRQPSTTSGRLSCHHCSS